MIHLLIPMSGQGTRYRQAGYIEPKPLIPVSGVPMVERLLESFPLDWPVSFVLAENHRNTALPELLQKLRPGCSLHYIPVHTMGPSHAALEALKSIEPQTPVLVSYCDYGMSWDARRFEHFVRDTACDACVISYRGFHAHYLNPVTYAYSRMNGERVVEVKEKGSFTPNRENEFASSGGYYFRTAELLAEAIEFQVANSLSLNGEYYTSLTVEALLRAKAQAREAAHVRVFEIPYFYQWGTPEDLRRYEYWEKTFRAYNREQGRGNRVDQVLMPMAGLGSRFQGITPAPKPLIPVATACGTEPMFKRALASLPKATKTVLVALDSFSRGLQPHVDSTTEIVSLAQTPSGQALSTEAGLAALDADDEVLVSSCDHGIVLAHAVWMSFRRDADCDAAIFTVHGFPGAERNPKAFAYVVPEDNTGPFPLVARVSVKTPVSSTPVNDAVLVGTFWFKSARLLGEGIDKLKSGDIRVNGELYLDSVFEVLKSMGKRVRMIPLDGYINWGDSDSLAEALYWHENFCGAALTKRARFPGVQE